MLEAPEVHRAVRDDLVHDLAGVAADSRASIDVLLLGQGIDITRTRVRDVNRDGVNDLELTMGFGGSVTLLGVSDFNAIDIQRESFPIFSETLF